MPTGNFGDIYAGFIAREMGMPIDKLVIATNSNDILARTLQTGSYSKGDVHATLSPSMDIQVSSNFERMMFDLSGRNGSAIKTYMADFADTGKITLSDAEISKARAVFEAKQVDDKTTSEVMAHLQQATGYVTDPHTAVGIEASKLLNADAAPRVTLSTAHPVKFGEAVQSATGISPELPSHMADLYDREEGYAELANDITALQTLILKGVGQ